MVEMTNRGFDTFYDCIIIWLTEILNQQPYY